MKQSQLDRAITSLEKRIEVLDLALTTLKQQRTSMPARVKKPKWTEPRGVESVK